MQDMFDTRSSCLPVSNRHIGGKRRRMETERETNFQVASPIVLTLYISVRRVVRRKKTTIFSIVGPEVVSHGQRMTMMSMVSNSLLAPFQPA